ncbi:flagella synthesis protein FlgN [Massilia sp. GCM10020059]|uniref:Flagellar protein FlgN n=1 Tax=Massilia agrisoli TaxID=2892444 RepID=A0ABS8ISZ7_9BURK|nr:flagellar protein FlgN [Massilia agrisoli]MCC6071303.1 flagellar protein FlgN [Massilia agrisoli]
MASPLDTLHDEQQLVSSLLDLMKQEQQCLIDADIEGLNAITPRKAERMNELAVLANQRHQALAAAGFAAEETGMQDWVAHAANSSASDAWSQLLALTRDAKEVNRVNGMLINKQMTHNQNLINAMRQPANAGDAAVYGPTGQATPGGPSRRFVVG